MEYEYGADAIIIPLEYYALIIAGIPKQKAIKKQKDFEIKKYDFDLKEEFTLKVPVPENSELKNYAYEGDYLYALIENEKDRNIIKLNIITKEITNYIDNKTPKFSQNGMEVNNGKVTMYGKVVTNDKYDRLYCCLSIPLCGFPMLFYKLNYVPTVYTIDMNDGNKSGKIYEMKNYVRVPSDVLQMEKSPNSDEYNFLMEYEGTDFGALHLLRKNFSAKVSVRTLKEGKFTKDLVLKKTADFYNTDTYLSVLQNNEKIVFGSYEVENKKRGQSVGFYIYSVDSNVKKYSKKIPWVSFKSYAELASKREKMIKRGVSVTLHPVYEIGDERVFLAELYTEIYDSRNNVSGKMVDELIGYLNYGALVFALDEKANIIWNYTFHYQKVEMARYYKGKQISLRETGNGKIEINLIEGQKLYPQSLDGQSVTKKKLSFKTRI